MASYESVGTRLMRPGQTIDRERRDRGSASCRLRGAAFERTQCAARTPPKDTAGRQRQRGAAALLLILTLIVILTIVLAPQNEPSVADAQRGRSRPRLRTP